MSKYCKKTQIVIKADLTVKHTLYIRELNNLINTNYENRPFVQRDGLS